MNENLELKLQAWIDGEVSPSEVRRLAELAERDPQVNQLVQELRMTRQLLAANPPEVAVPETREFYWSKIERQIQNLPMEPSPTGSRSVFGWRRWMASIAGVAALGVMVLIAIGQFAPTATFDEVSATADGMEAMTFHDQTAGVTVVWLQDGQDTQSTQAVDADAVDSNSDLEL